MTGAVATVTPNGVLRALDETLKRLIQRELGKVGVGPVEVTFEAPERDRAATWPSPAVNLFLYDLREPELPRDRSWHESAGQNGRSFMDRAPVRLECSFAVTVWTQAVLEEHQVLSQVLSILLAYPVLEPDEIEPELRIGTPPVGLPARVAHGKGDGRSDFWNAIGSPYKLSFEYAVTVFLVPGVRVERGPRVGTTAVGGPQPGVLDPRGEPRGAALRSSGGRVVTAGGAPAKAAWVLIDALGRSAVTQAGGRFDFQGLPDGQHAVQARGADGSTATGRLAVPGPPVTLQLTSS
jgi:hypothetical protein